MPQDIVQPETTESKDPFVAPVLPIKTQALAMMNAGSRQMTDPPDAQKQHQEQAVQPRPVVDHRARDIPAARLKVLEGRFHPHTAGVAAHAGAPSRLIGDEEPDFLAGRLPDCTELRQEWMRVPDERWAKPGPPWARDELGQ